jgi:hypothetical protein
VGLLHLRAIRAGPHHCPLRTNSAPPTASSVPVTATVRSHGRSPRRHKHPVWPSRRQQRRTWSADDALSSRTSTERQRPASVGEQAVQSDRDSGDHRSTPMDVVALPDGERAVKHVGPCSRPALSAAAAERVRSSLMQYDLGFPRS